MHALGRCHQPSWLVRGHTLQQPLYLPRTAVRWKFTWGGHCPTPPWMPEARKCDASPNQNKTRSPQSCTSSAGGKNTGRDKDIRPLLHHLSVTAFSFLEATSLWHVAMCFHQRLEAPDPTGLSPWIALPSLHQLGQLCYPSKTYFGQHR